MKKDNTKVDISFTTPVTEEKVGNKEEPTIQNDQLIDAKPAIEYSSIVEDFYDSHQSFQRDFYSAMAKPNPSTLLGKLTGLITTFQEAVDRFKTSEFVVEDKFKPGHEYLLKAVNKYDEFLNEYPKTFTMGFKGIKVAKQLSKLSTSADKDIKKAFELFEEALKEG